MSKSAKKRSPSKSVSYAPSDTRPENVNPGSKQSRVIAMGHPRGQKRLGLDAPMVMRKFWGKILDPLPALGKIIARGKFLDPEPCA
jgi:hypothetical protein